MSKLMRGGVTIKKARILVIEKDQVLAREVAEALIDEGYKVTVAGDALNGLKSAYEIYPDLIIMDRELPMVSAEDTCVRIRQVIYLPILVLGDSPDGIEILELGADAYMTKPPDLNELVARVNSLLRRNRNGNSSGSDTGLEEKVPQRQNLPRGLTPTEFRLASCLILNKNKLLDRFRIISEVWGGKKVTVETLRFYIRRLQQKLTTGRISTLRGVGYYFSDSHR